MKVKEFLKGIEKKEHAIQHLEDLIDKIKAMAEYKGVAINPNGGGSGTRDEDRMATYMCKAVDLENKLVRIKEQYNDDIERATMMILNISDGKTLQVMWMRYVKYQKWETIASDLDITYQWTLKLHGRGLEELQKKYPEFS